MSFIPTSKQAQMQALKSKLSDLNDDISFANGTVALTDRFLDQRETLIATCSKHGEYSQQRIWAEARGRAWEKFSRCPHCISEEIAAVEAEIKQYKVADLLDHARIPERFTECSFDSYQPVNPRAKRNLSMLKSYVQNWPEMYANGTSLIMSGKPGTGKNHLAVALTKAIIEQHQASVLLTSVLRIIRAVRRTWGKDSEYTEDQIMAIYTDVDLLVIDEIGVQYSSNSEMITLFEIINCRYERKLPTVMISNLSPAEMSTAIGDRLTDRMVEGDGATLVFDWDSYRSTKGAKAV